MSEALKLGYLIPTREQVMRGDHSTTSLLNAGRYAADQGFDSLWVGDSLTARPRHDPLTLLGGLATVIPKLQLGTSVLLPALRNPVVLAQQLATIDQLSEGRLVVGAGIAADVPTIRAEFQAAGVPFEKRVGRLLEGFDLCRALWRGQPVDWEGRWHLKQQQLAPTPVQAGGPPIWLGAGVEAGIKRAARQFDGWMPIGPDPDTFGQRCRFYQNECAVLAKTPTTCLYLTLCLDEDETLAETRLNDYLEQYYKVPAQAMRRIQACCGGNIETILKFLHSYVVAGAQHLIIRVVGDYQRTLQQLALHRTLITDGL
ncbi:MAG: LLM class flavin-dependent oxidoreductase [Pseudomonadota bacterium]